MLESVANSWPLKLRATSSTTSSPPRAPTDRITVELRPRNPDIASTSIAYHPEATLTSPWEQLVKDHYRNIKYRPGIGYNHYRHGTPTGHEWRCVGREYPSVGYNQGPRALYTLLTLAVRDWKVTDDWTDAFITFPRHTWAALRVKPCPIIVVSKLRTTSSNPEHGQKMASYLQPATWMPRQKLASQMQILMP